jgi:hypothetical protein
MIVVTLVGTDGMSGRIDASTPRQVEIAMKEPRGILRALFLGVDR